MKSVSAQEQKVRTMAILYEGEEKSRFVSVNRLVFDTRVHQGRADSRRILSFSVNWIDSSIPWRCCSRCWTLCLVCKNLHHRWRTVPCHGNSLMQVKAEVQIWQTSTWSATCSSKVHNRWIVNLSRNCPNETEVLKKFWSSYRLLLTSLSSPQWRPGYPDMKAYNLCPLTKVPPSNLPPHLCSALNLREMMFPSLRLIKAELWLF